MPFPTSVVTWDSGAVNSTPTTSGHRTSGFATNEVPTSAEFNYWMSSVAEHIQSIESGLYPGNLEITGNLKVDGTAEIVGNTTVDGDLTVDGTIKFASESLTIPAASATPIGPWTYSGSWDPNGTNQYLDYPIALPAGCRILSWTLNAIKSSDASKSLSASLYDGTTLIGTTQSNSANAPGAITLEAVSVNYTIPAGHTITLRVAGNGQASGFDFVGSLDIAYDRP